MEPIRIAIVGCGGHARAHVRRLRSRSDVRIAALCSRTGSSIQSLVDAELAEYAPTPPRYTSTSQMYSSEPLDAVIVCTPHNLHLTQTAEALEHGCHVLIEKPMVVTAAEATELEAIASSHPQLKVAVGYSPAYTPAMQKVRDAVQQGSHGTLELVSGYLSQNWLHPTSGSWRQNPELSGGGQLMDSGAHLWHSVVSTVGSPVVEVYAMIDRIGSPVDVNSVALLRFANGVRAAITIGGNSRVDGSHLSLIFDGGRIDVDGWKGRWFRSYRDGHEPVEQTDVGESDPDANFVEAILGRAESMAPLSDGVAVAWVIDAIYRSVESGAPVSLE